MKCFTRFLLLCSCLPLASFAAELQPFSLSFDINYSIAKGEMKLSLSRSGKDRYTIESFTRARGIAKSFAPHPITETAQFDIHRGKVRGLSYRLDDGSNEKKENISIRYDWTKQQADIQSEKGIEQKPLSEDSMDQLIMQAAAIQSIQQGKSDFSFQQIKPGRNIQLYQYSRQGEEIIAGPEGDIETIKYERSRPNSDKSTYYWYAPALGYAPVRIERFKKGKSVFKGILKTIHAIDS